MIYNKEIKIYKNFVYYYQFISTEIVLLQNLSSIINTNQNLITTLLI